MGTYTAHCCTIAAWQQPAILSSVVCGGSFRCGVSSFCGRVLCRSVSIMAAHLRFFATLLLAAAGGNRVCAMEPLAILSEQAVWQVVVVLA